jgi:nucleoside 2-deoxyribosyltransferase
MSEKKYQVFVSSTYEDLKEERKAVIDALIGADCFPIGMEFFPATGKEQFEYIKTLIEESDFYVLIIAGRYGSVDEDGVSYTEKEYDYAIEKKIPVISFIKVDKSISKENTQEDKTKELNEFIKKVKLGKIVKEFSSVEDLQHKIITSINRNKKIYNRPGWTRRSKKNDIEYLNELAKQLAEKEKGLDIINLKGNSVNENLDNEKVYELLENEVTIFYNLKLNRKPSSDEEKDVCSKINKKCIENFKIVYIINIVGKDMFNELNFKIFEKILNHCKKEQVKKELKLKERKIMSELVKSISITRNSLNFIILMLEDLNILQVDSSGFIYVTEYGKKIYYKILQEDNSKRMYSKRQ